MSAAAVWEFWHAVHRWAQLVQWSQPGAFARWMREHGL